MAPLRTAASGISLLALALLGCTQSTEPVEPAARAVQVEGEDTPFQARGTLQVRVTLEPRKIVAGSAPAVLIQVSNRSPRTVWVGGGSSCHDYGFVVRDERGDMVADTWSGADCTAGFSPPWPFLAGEAFSGSAYGNWKLAHLAPGRYWVEGVLLTSTPQVSPRTLLIVVASEADGEDAAGKPSAQAQ